MTAASIIEKLNLARHPEGGFYRETYRGENIIALDNGEQRNTGTAIYYLLKDNDKSHFHKVRSDELWLFHQGEPLEISVITDEGKISITTLGNRLDLNEQPQLAVKADTWFGARIKNKNGFALVSCVVAPGFDFKDFELGNKDELIKSFPNIKDEIEELSL